jgi:riboflavin synthase
MFTGLIDGTGTIKRITTTRAGRELTISCPYEDLSKGESVSINGACLTVRECGPRWLTVAMVLAFH